MKLPSYNEKDWDFENIVTEDDAPWDSIYESWQHGLLVSPLYVCWDGPGEGRSFHACGHVGLFYHPDEPPLVPDMMLSLDVRLAEDIQAKRNRAYFLPVFRKPPEVAVEVVCTSDGEEDTRKKVLYANVGVLYYVIWDPDDMLKIGRLAIYHLRDGAYERHEGSWFPELQLGLRTWHGKYNRMTTDWLRWYGADGELLLAGREVSIWADEMAARANEEHRRGDRLTAKLPAGKRIHTES